MRFSIGFLAGILTVTLAQQARGQASTGQASNQADPRRTFVVNVFENCRDAVVNINTTRVRESLRSPLEEIFDFGLPRRLERVVSVGSGVVIHPAGYLVTNAHVVAQTSDVRVTFANQETLSATVVSVDPEHDLAVLKVDAPRPMAHVRLGRSDDIMVGEPVVAIGNPLGLQHTVTTGIVSAVGRQLEFRGRPAYQGLIQTDAAINPGNSGGPLLNALGELIGINTAIRGDAQNVGFAIPVSRLWELLPLMLDIERQQRVRFGLHVTGPQAAVVEVSPGSPADAAGVRPGDRVVRFDGDPIRDAIDYYVHLLQRRPGDEVALELAAGQSGPTRRVVIPLERRPPPDGRALARRLLGLDVAELSATDRRRYELPECLIVQEADRGGPAWQAGVRRGDLITRVDRISVPKLSDLGNVLEAAQPGGRLVLQVLRPRGDVLYYGDFEVWTRGSN